MHSFNKYEDHRLLPGDTESKIEGTTLGKRTCITMILDECTNFPHSRPFYRLTDPTPLDEPPVIISYPWFQRLSGVFALVQSEKNQNIVTHVVVRDLAGECLENTIGS